VHSLHRRLQPNNQYLSPHNSLFHKNTVSSGLSNNNTLLTVLKQKKEIYHPVNGHHHFPDSSGMSAGIKDIAFLFRSPPVQSAGKTRSPEKTIMLPMKEKMLR
jgi:hypothetical protein